MRLKKRIIIKVPCTLALKNKKTNIHYLKPKASSNQLVDSIFARLYSALRIENFAFTITPAFKAFH